MVQAFVLINSQPGTEQGVFEKIKALSVVKEAHKIFGAYDIIAKIEEKDTEMLHETITRQIRQIEKVISTLTLIIL